MSDIEIKEAISNKEIEITGIDEVHIGSSSVDLHLDNRSMILDSEKVKGSDFIHVAGQEPFHGLSFKDKERSSALFTEYNNWEEIVIYPGEFYILSTVERIKFADNIAGFVQGRSSLARMGIQVHCAGFCDVGFEGTITLEVTNLTLHPILISKNTRICQLVFAKTGKPSETPYGKNKRDKYQNQSGPTITRISKDYEN